MLNDINLTDVRSFVVVAKLGNFTKAADALSVSRSHISRQISHLESQMGVTLFTRTTRTMRLTLAGKQFFAQCEKALNEIDQALIAAADDVEEVKGLIRINCVGGFLGEDLIAQYVGEFMQLYPDVSVHLDFSSHRIDLIEDEFDVAFRMGVLQDAGFVATSLMDIEMVTLASPSYIEQYGSPQHPKELEFHRTLTGSVTRWSFRDCTDVNKHYDVSVDGHLVCKNGRALVNGARQGNGIIRVPLMYCVPEVEAGTLVQLMPQWVIPSVPFSAIFHKDKYQPKRLRAFIDFIKERFR